MTHKTGHVQQETSAEAGNMPEPGENDRGITGDVLNDNDLPNAHSRRPSISAP